MRWPSAFTPRLDLSILRWRSLAFDPRQDLPFTLGRVWSQAMHRNKRAACAMYAGLFAMTAAAADAPHAFSPEISADDFAAHIRVLASDEFGGRDPATPGEAKTLEYLQAQ